ncbi:MAG: tyrosinase family protein [Mycobacteriales bacterium]
MPTRQRMRASVEQLSTGQGEALRASVGAMAALSDDRGYQYFAGLHGGPPKSYCQHGTVDTLGRYHGAPLFLPWHRAYLHFLELAMQDRIAGVTIAWWDWTSPGSHSSGIPALYKGANNPLTSQPIAKGFTRPRGVRAQSWRDPSNPTELPAAADVTRVLGLGSFQDFSTQLEQQLHNKVHGWVGGAMGSVPTAAFDPVFYAHHTMVDRVWRLWQVHHGKPGPPASSWSAVLEPFPLTVGDVLDVAKLGYDYAATTTEVGGTS